MDFKAIEKKWQKKWEDAKIFQVKDDPKKKKFYCLEMFPYPSGSGLHMGHAKNYSIGDIYARFKRMNGYNVLYPMGYDSFGLPAENAAIKNKSHPKVFTEQAIANFIRQQHELGLSYDWSRKLATHTPDYYRWTQWLFLQLFKKGLAYKKKAAVNWCPQCKTVLANEQVVSGKCWRHETTDVEIKELEQWFLKITDYAEELLTDLNTLTGWPERIRVMQRNWIGKSEGTLVNFTLKGTKKIIPVFTTRPDTLYGVTFLVYAPEHPDVMEFVKGTSYEKDVRAFVKKVVVDEKFTRAAEDKEKEGLFIGKNAIHPLTGEELPIYIANFVLMDYGTGTVMAVPAHDQRDFEFAKKYKIAIKQVIQPTDKQIKQLSAAYLDSGVLINSEEFNGLDNETAKTKITAYLGEKKLGKKTVNYKLKDWLISRQRYWGTPIPIVYCDECGIVPVAEKELPVLLPEDVIFGGEGNPILTSKTFVHTSCPTCKGKARRETDTMDTFIDSSWYFLRYTGLTKNAAFDKEAVKYWLPVDQYIGGAEHAVMHLLYARFFTKALRDLKLLSFDEPFTNLFNQGMLHKDGFVMSKSRGNVVTQEEISEKYGIDTARVFLNFGAGPDKDLEWTDKGIEGASRLVHRFLSLAEKVPSTASTKDALVLSKIHRLIKEVGEDVNALKYHLALNKLLSFVNYVSPYRAYVSAKVYQDAFEKLILLFAPFTPHICEELWSQRGKKTFVSLEQWPAYNSKKINVKAEAAEDFFDFVKVDIRSILSLVKIQPKKIFLFVSTKEKYPLFLDFCRETERDFKALMKKYGSKSKDAVKIITGFVQNKLNLTGLTQAEELKALQENSSFLEKEFNLAVEIKTAEQSNEEKARQALPGKPAILIV